MDFTKTIFAIMGGIFMAFGTGIPAFNPFSDFGVSLDNQLKIGGTLFTIAMIAHLLGGGSVFPWRKM